MFKVINPNWKSAIEKKAETHAPAVNQWLKDSPENQYVSLAELRAGLPAIAAELNRPVLNQICRIIGLAVDGVDDQAV